ncbi:hypothetical protein [Enterococcus sp. AZ196]|uniref:hypothetical protein n=1 Tax=Enterococcus sp. AZ196 TaxID=2774659 RepID=UPI003D2B0E9A
MFLLRWEDDESSRKNSIGVLFRSAVLIIAIVGLHFATLFTIYWAHYINLFSGKSAIRIENLFCDEAVFIYEESEAEGISCLYYETYATESPKELFPSWKDGIGDKKIVRYSQVSKKNRRILKFESTQYDSGLVGTDAFSAFSLAKRTNNCSTSDLIFLYVKSLGIVIVIVAVAIAAVIAAKVILGWIWLAIQIFVFMGIRRKKIDKE